MLPFLDGLRDITFFNVLVRMLVAVFCSAAIGLERYLYLVAQLPTDMTRIGAQVITGLGFIGAGTIIVTRKHTVKGLTTAAGLWATGVIGLAAGSGFYEGAVISTILVLVAEIFFSEIGQKIRSTPEFNAIINCENKQALDHALRFIKDRGVTISALQVSSSNDDGSYVYSALVHLRPSNNLQPEHLMELVSNMTGIFAANVVKIKGKRLPE